MSNRERPKRSSEKDLIDSLIHDLGKEDLVDRFVMLQMVNQEREEQMERQQYQIEHLTNFLKQADQTLVIRLPTRCETQSKMLRISSIDVSNGSSEDSELSTLGAFKMP